MAAALIVGAGCAALLAFGRLAPTRPSARTSAYCGAACTPLSPVPGAGTGNPAGSHAAPAPGTPASVPAGKAGLAGPPTATAATRAARPSATGPEQHESGSAPASATTQPAAASSAPISASALVQFKVTSHWGDGYRAAVTVTNTGAVPLTGWRLTFQVTGATLHQPTDTGETAMSGAVVTVTPAAWRPALAAGAAATFGFGFDGVLTAPADCRLDGRPCELTFVPAVAGQ